MFIITFTGSNLSLTLGAAVFAEAGLAFLGLSDPSVVSWGKMIDNAFRQGAVLDGAWWAILPPGLAVAALVLATTLIGRAIEDASNPRLTSVHLADERLERRPIPST